jgi:hypothetical protein
MATSSVLFQLILLYNILVKPWGCGGMVDTHALGACAERREGSSPFIPTKPDITEVRLHSAMNLGYQT